MSYWSIIGKKIAEYDEEHDHMVSKLEDYRITYEEQVRIIGDKIRRASP